MINNFNGGKQQTLKTSKKIKPRTVKGKKLNYKTEIIPEIKELKNKDLVNQGRVKYINTRLLSSDDIKTIFIFNKKLIEEYNIKRDKLYTKLKNKIEKNEKGFDNIKLFTDKYIENIQKLKISLVNKYVTRLIIDKPELKNNLGFYDYFTSKKETLPRSASSKSMTRSMSGGSLKYKNIQDPEIIVPELCNKVNQTPSKNIFDFINNNKDERVRKNDDNNDLFDLIENPNEDVDINVEFDETVINVGDGKVLYSTKRSRQFLYKKYNRELLFYIESKIIDNNLFIQDFTNSHVEYLKTLDIGDRYTINDYTENLYQIINTDWKNDEYKEKIERMSIEGYLTNYFTPQIFKLLKYKGLLDRDDDNEQEILKLHDESLVNAYSSQVKSNIEEIFKLYELDLNRIIASAPPRLYTFECFRGASRNYIPETKTSDDVKLCVSDRFTSYTIDIFNETFVSFIRRASPDSRLYNVTISPTSKMLFIAPLSKAYEELEILQATDQKIDPLYDNKIFNIFYYKIRNNFLNDNLMCDNDNKNEVLYKVKEIFLI